MKINLVDDWTLEISDDNLLSAIIYGTLTTEQMRLLAAIGAAVILINDSSGLSLGQYHLGEHYADLPNDLPSWVKKQIERVVRDEV